MKQALLIAAVLGYIDPTCTVDQICSPGYTALIRPSSAATTKLKIKQMEMLGLKGDPSEFEEDHIQPMELCGDPGFRYVVIDGNEGWVLTHPENLTPQPWPRARAKDVMETRFHRLVCKGKMKLEDAQREIVKFE